MKDGEIIFRTWIKKETKPYGKVSCADCGKHKPLFYLGKHGEQTDICEECLKKIIKKHDVKGKIDEGEEDE